MSLLVSHAGVQPARGVSARVGELRVPRDARAVVRAHPRATADQVRCALPATRPARKPLMTDHVSPCVQRNRCCLHSWCVCGRLRWLGRTCMTDRVWVCGHAVPVTAVTVPLFFCCFNGRARTVSKPVSRDERPADGAEAAAAEQRPARQQARRCGWCRRVVAAPFRLCSAGTVRRYVAARSL